MCLIATLALVSALILTLLDRKLKLLQVIPTPLQAWQQLCQRFTTKLHRKERSDKALRWRSRILLITLLSIAFSIGLGLSYLLNHLDNDYLDTLLLALCLIRHPISPNSQLTDKSAVIRQQIEIEGVMLLQRIIAPLVGWIILGWTGVMVSLTLGTLRIHSASLKQAFAQPIRRLSRWFFMPSALLGCGLISLAACFTSKGRPLIGLRAGLSAINQPFKATIYTLAESLNSSLAGPKGLYLALLGNEWLGKGSARLQAPDLKRWRWLELIAQGLYVALLLILSLLLL